MNVEVVFRLTALLALVVGCLGLSPPAAPPPHSHTPSIPLADNPDPPSETVKLIFIHHSTGENWLADDNGGLGMALRDNNTFVSDTNYGWGPEGIGDYTDIGHWWLWFRGPNSSTYLSALYAESGQHSAYSRLPTDPGGENEIIMFKSCFPNSYISGNPDDPPTTGYNPLRGQDASSEYHTVANVKGIYNDILEYFATRQDKLFVLIVTPPLVALETNAAHAANARAVANWLMDDWLEGYPYYNVAVFDFYNVLTSNGGDRYTHDLGWETGNHHRWWSGAVQHIQTVDNNFAAYGSDFWDSHPTQAGNQKATGEFVQLLNVFYHRWKEGEGTPTPTPTGTPSTAMPTASPTATSTPLTATPTATATPTGTVTPPAEHIIYLPLILKQWSPAAEVTPTPTATPSVGSLDVALTVMETSGPSISLRPRTEPVEVTGPSTSLRTSPSASLRTGLARTEEPVTSGVPIPRSVNLTDLSSLRLLESSGQPIPAQFTPLARWGGAPDDASKPVRWLLLDFQADVPASGAAQYRLVNNGGTTPTYRTLSMADGADAITVDTGAAQFSISKTDGRLSAAHLAAPLIGRAVDSGGAVYTTTGPVTVTVALSGPMRISVHVKGAYRNPSAGSGQAASGTPLLDYTSRYWFYAGQPIVRLFHTVENNIPCPLVEYAQLDCYDIGSGGSVTVADVSLLLPTDLGSNLTYQAAGEGSPASGNLTDDLLLYQDSSGTNHWDTYPTFTDWWGKPLNTRPRMQSYITFRGYRTTLGGMTVDSGDQAAGWLSIVDYQLDTAPTYEEWMGWYPNLLVAIESTDFYGLFDYGDWPIDYEGYGVAPLNCKYDNDYGMWL